MITKTKLLAAVACLACTPIASSYAQLQIDLDSSPPRGVIGEKYRWSIPYSYSGTNELTWSSTNLPDFIHVNSNGIFWAKPWSDRMPPEGSAGFYHDVTFTVTDGVESSTYGPFTWIVEASAPDENGIIYPRIDVKGTPTLLPDTQFSDTRDAANFLFQSTFGPRHNRTDESYPFDAHSPNGLLSMGFDAWFNEQLSAQPSYHYPRYREYVEINQNDEIASTRYRTWWDISLTADDQLRQRMAFALSQIVVVSEKDATLDQYPGLLAQYYDVLVEHALGNYRDLILDVARHPAMGYYLTLLGSQKHDDTLGVGPDDNFAREIMQLFTIGLDELGTDGLPLIDNQGQKLQTYQDSDVDELARVLSGWHLQGNSDWDNATQGDMNQLMIAYADKHDTTAKQVMRFNFPAGNSAEQDLNYAVDMLFYHPNTPTFISHQLIQRLVKSNPSPEYVQRVANVFRNNGSNQRGDLAMVARAILADPEARDGAAEKAKEPLILVANLGRAMEIRGDINGFFKDLDTTSIGQIPLGAPSVFNFYTPNSAPQGPIQDAGLVAPEFSVLNEANFKGIANVMHDMIKSNGRYDSPSVGEKNKINITPCYNLGSASKLDQLITYTEQTLLHKPIHENTAEVIQQFSDDDDVGAYQARTRCKGVLWTVATSPEYMTQE